MAQGCDQPDATWTGSVGAGLAASGLSNLSQAQFYELLYSTGSTLDSGPLQEDSPILRTLKANCSEGVGLSQRPVLPRRSSSANGWY